MTQTAGLGSLLGCVVFFVLRQLWVINYITLEMSRQTTLPADVRPLEVNGCLYTRLLSKGVFHLSELAVRTVAGSVILTAKSAFSEGFCWKTISFLHTV